MPSKKSRPARPPARPARPNTGNRLYGPAPHVGLAWLAGAAATAVAIGAAAAYLLLCVIFYQNQAMMIFRPSPKITTTPATVGLAYQAVLFGLAKNGQPQLTGWWIPATPLSSVKDSAAKNTPSPKATILYLHGASGSLSNSVPQLQALHTLGVNIFAIDYQGFGNSAGTRPTEQLADRDALAAWRYLTVQRSLPPTTLVVFGQGAGATFATYLAAHRTVAALVLTEISPTAHTIFEQDQRARLLPLFLLAKEHMNPAPELKRLKTPKLLLDWPAKKPGTTQKTTESDFLQAHGPKQIVSLPNAAPAGLANAVRPFLSRILPAAQ